MPAKSKAQRQAAGMATAIQEGKMKPQSGTPSAAMAKMPPASLRNFATTPEQGLPAAAPKPAPMMRPPGGMGRTKVMKTGAMKKKAF
jgi:hypothetical protein